VNVPTLEENEQFSFDGLHESLVPWQPTRTTGLAMLQQFLPKAGRIYQAQRNEDSGSGNHFNVSRLSPYLRRRLLSEQEVLAKVLDQHSQSDAFKFVQEVFWRTYWKGWLEHRPLLWQGYQQDLREVFERVGDDKWRRDGYSRAVDGQTEIRLFNQWVQELRETGYLHNHARMWFASIWIFTLGLPWQLGADFFLRHLLDGDPASNTLGWRWVAGLHTQGKTYLATASNIRKYAAARVHGYCDHDSGLARLATSAQPVEETLSAMALQKVPVEWPKPFAARGDSSGSLGLVLTDDDLSLDLPFQPTGVVALPASSRSNVAATSPLVNAFSKGAIADAVQRADTAYASTLRAPSLTADGLDEIMQWVDAHGFKELVHAYAPSGNNQQAIAQLQTLLAGCGVRLTSFMRDYDRLVWPHAQKGFFQLGKRIPEFLAAMELAEPFAEQRAFDD
jgi:deoxyribodipyrimidine photo-lyase